MLPLGFEESHLEQTRTKCDVFLVTIIHEAAGSKHIQHLAQNSAPRVSSSVIFIVATNVPDYPNQIDF